MPGAYGWISGIVNRILNRISYPDVDVAYAYRLVVRAYEYINYAANDEDVREAYKAFMSNGGDARLNMILELDDELKRINFKFTGDIDADLRNFYSAFMRHIFINPHAAVRFAYVVLNAFTVVLGGVVRRE